MKNRSVARLALAGSIVAGAALGGAVTIAGVGAQDDTSTTVAEDFDATGHHGGRGEHLREVLDGLVEDETLTREQADKVAVALEEARPERGAGHSHRGRGHGPGKGHAEIAEALGMEPSELRDALAEGQSLADVAEAQGVDPQTIIDAMTTQMDERLVGAVEAGRLTQEEADAKKSEMVERATAIVNGEAPEGRSGRGGPWGGKGPGHDHGADDGDSEGD